MSIAEISGIVTSILAILFSFIGLIQSGRANKLSDEANSKAEKANELSKCSNNIAEVANRTAEEALNDSQKDYMPLVKLVDEIKCEGKNVEELCSEITFDSDGGIECNEYGEICFEEDEYLPICLTIKNIGKGIIKKMAVKSFLMCVENKESFEKKLDEEFDVETIFYEPDLNCEQEFTLCDNEKVDINILLPEEKCQVDIDQLDETIEKNDILIIMELELFSTNKSSYCQKSLWCTFKNGTAKLSSFDDIVPTSYEEFKERMS